MRITSAFQRLQDLHKPASLARLNSTVSIPTLLSLAARIIISKSIGDGIQLSDKGVTGDSRNKSKPMFLVPAKGITTTGRYLRLAAHWHTDTKEAKKGSSMSTTARGKLSSCSFLRTADFWAAGLQTICKKLSAEIENDKNASIFTGYSQTHFLPLHQCGNLSASKDLLPTALNDWEDMSPGVRLYVHEC